jgi:hypothetical protein
MKFIAFVLGLAVASGAAYFGGQAFLTDSQSIQPDSQQGASASAPTERVWGEPRNLTRVDDERIDESSGLAPSSRESGVWFTHNDSGDRARFFSFDEEGRVLGEFRVTNAENFDWEDMAAATIGGRRMLLFGDIGDNRSVRKSIQIYGVPEPNPRLTTKWQDVEAEMIIDLTYPDGPRDAETLMVHPRTREIFIVEKTKRETAGVYWIPMPERSGSYQLTKIGEIAFGKISRLSRHATGGDFSPDGRHAVIRTYLNAWEFEVPQDVAKWIESTPRPLPIMLDVQGEAIAYRPDGKAVVTTAEGRPMVVNTTELTSTR